MRVVAPPSAATRRHVRKTITFADSSGTVTVFAITGRVRVDRLTAFCTATLVEDGAVTGIELGGATDPNAFILSTNPSDIAANQWWANASPVGGVEQIDPLQIDAVIDEDIILTITGGTDLDSGSIQFDVSYFPLTEGALLS